MLKESRMIHGHGELYPHHYSSLLKYSNLLKAKRLAHDAGTHRKSVDRLQLDNDAIVESSGKSIPKLELLEYYQIVTPKDKETTIKRGEQQQQQQQQNTPKSTSLQPLKAFPPTVSTQQQKQQQQPDLTLKTANIYRSYLEYSSTNPFESNYDVVTKNKNSELLSDSTYRFNRAQSSLSILSHSIEFKKFSAASVAPPIDPRHHHNQLVNSAPLDLTSSSTGRIMVLRQPPAAAAVTNSSSRLNNETLVAESKTAAATGRTSQHGETSNHHRKSSARTLYKASNATTTNNQFLNYRNEEYLTNGSSQMNLRKSKVESRNSSRLKSATNNKENQTENNNTNGEQQQTTHRNNNKGPESYLESSKLEHIRKWVDEVNRVQAKSGKWGETINKILFYD